MKEIKNKVYSNRIAIISISMALLLFLLYNIFSVNIVQALSKYGSRGDEVIQIQTKLKRWGYYKGNIDRNIWKPNIRSSKIFSKEKWISSRWNSRKENIRSNGNFYI